MYKIWQDTIAREESPIWDAAGYGIEKGERLLEEQCAAKLVHMLTKHSLESIFRQLCPSTHDTPMTVHDFTAWIDKHELVEVGHQLFSGKKNHEVDERPRGCKRVSIPR